YNARVRDLLLLPYARRFLTMGGLIWRIALYYGPHLFTNALLGPSSDAYIHNATDRMGLDMDDMVTEDDIALLLGTTTDKHSLWPPLDVWGRYQQWTGEWSEYWETWFQKRVSAIERERSDAFLPRKDWK
ncbi:hypothetical protein F4604DRAFT_1508933, partial [Suillus subluteus]